jgi:hypothetical protein
MTEYQTGTTKVEATQWFKNGDHPLDESILVGIDGNLVLTEGKIVRRFRNPNQTGTESCDLCGHLMHIHGWIDGSGEVTTVCPSDFVVTTEEGEVYSCPAGIFATTYNIEVP